jgi:hypothetical protein
LLELINPKVAVSVVILLIVADIYLIYIQTLAHLIQIGGTNPIKFALSLLLIILETLVKEGL